MTIPDKIQLYLGDTRDPIASAIAVSKRSISSEVRHRVMMSFQMEAAIAKAVKDLERCEASLDNLNHSAYRPDLVPIIRMLQYATQSASGE